MFGFIRKKFGITFCKVREAINRSPPPLDHLKCFLEDCYPHLNSQIVHANSIDDILDVVRDHCTLTNISCLESIVERFDIEEVKIYIQAYRDIVQSFCKEIKPFLDESFKMRKSHSLLHCETAVFVLNWDPKGCTLEDINSILAESLEENVQIRVIREGN